MNGGSEYGSSAWRAYNEGKGLSKKEIRQKELEKILNKDGLENEDDGIVNLFNGILHSEFEIGYIFSKSEHGSTFELSPHDYETKELVSLLEESIVHLRGIMEFARSVIQSTFIDQKQEKLLEGEYFQYRNMKILHTKSYRELWETMDKMEELDLKKYT